MTDTMKIKIIADIPNTVLFKGNVFEVKHRGSTGIWIDPYGTGAVFVKSNEYEVTK